MTPEEAWPAVDAHHGASGGYGGFLDGYANGWDGWDQRSQSGPRSPESQGRHSANSYRTGGYTGTTGTGTGTGGYGGSLDGYANGWDGWAARTRTGGTTGTDDWSGWAARTRTGGTAGTEDWSGWAMGGSGHAERTDAFDGVPASYGTAPNGYSAAPTGYAGAATGYAGAATGYADDLDAFDGSRNGYASTPNGYAGTPNGYAGTLNGYGAAPAGYAGELDGFDGAGSGYGVSDGFAEAEDRFDGPAGYLDHGQYAALDSSDPMLSAPDAGIHPDGWRAEQDRRLEMNQRGTAVGAVTVFLAVAVAAGVSTLAAAFVRPQASPMTTAGNVLIDRLPFSLRNFAVQHFGGHSHSVLLLGMYVVLGLLALEIGMLTRRAVAGGVIGIAALSLLGAFIVITRPGGRATDMMPAVIGGLVGVAALLWLRRASAPTPEYPDRRSRRRA